MQNSGEQRSFNPSMSRRDFLRLAGTFGAGIVLTACGVPWPGISPVELGPKDIPEGSPLGVPQFRGTREPQKLKKVEDWNAQKLEEILDKAAKASLENGGKEIIVDLPDGEITIDKRIDCTVANGAKIKIKGHEKGSRLRLDPNLSEIPKKWGSFAERNILYFKDMEGELAIDGVDFHGGSERAGKSGYQAPASPWDAIVFIVGSGDGWQYKPDMAHAGQRKGKAVVSNCYFSNSESEGLMMQNIGIAEVHNCQGRNLDVLINSSWCDSVIGENISGENCTSDGFYITSAQRVDLKDCAVKTARQAYDLQGVAKASLDSCHSYDCGKAFELTLSETDKTTQGGDIGLMNCHSDGCMEVYSIGPLHELTVRNSKNDYVSAWMNGYLQHDFLHRDGLVRPEELGNTDTPVRNYTFQDSSGNRIDTNKTLNFSGVAIRLAKDPWGSTQLPLPDHWYPYKLPQMQGILYTKEG